MFVLSTAHLRPETAEAADDFAANEAVTVGYESHPLNRVAYGYLFAAHGYPLVEDEDPDLPQDVIDCANYIGDEVYKGKSTPGTFYVLFDCDGPVVDELPTYEW